MDENHILLLLAAAGVAIAVMVVIVPKYMSKESAKTVGAVVSPTVGSDDGGNPTDPGANGLGGGGGNNEEPAIQPGELSGEALDPQMYQDYVPEQGRSQLEVDDMMPYGFDPDDPINKNRITVDGVPAATAMADQTFYANVGPQLLTKKRFQNTLAIQSAGPGSAGMIDKAPNKKIRGMNPNQFLRQAPRVPLMQGTEVLFNGSDGYYHAYASMTGAFPKSAW
jgi:hypothetical protein